MCPFAISRQQRCIRTADSAAWFWYQSKRFWEISSDFDFNCVVFIFCDSIFVKSDTFFISAALAKVSGAQFDIAAAAAAAVKLLGFSDICRCHVGCSCSAHCVRGDHPMAGITLLEYCATNMWVSHNGLLAPSPDVCHCYTVTCVAMYWAGSHVCVLPQSQFAWATARYVTLGQLSAKCDKTGCSRRWAEGLAGWSSASSALAS